MRRRAGWLLAVLIAFGCEEETTPTGPTPEPWNPGPAPPRVLVVNSLSETLSSLNPDDGTMTIQAALLGTWANRVTLSPDGSDLLVTASGANAVHVFFARNLALRTAIDLGTGRSPWLAQPTIGTEALVSEWASGTLRRIDLHTGRAGASLATSTGPEGIAVAGEKAWIACTNYQAADGAYGPGWLDVVDLVNWEKIASVAVGRNPQDALIGPSGRVHVVCTGTYGTGPSPETGSVHVVDPTTNAVVGTVDLGGAPGRLARGPGDEIWVAGFSGGVRRYDGVSLDLLDDPADPALRSAELSAVDRDPATNTMYVTSFGQDLLIAIDETTGLVSDVWVVGDGPVDVKVVRPQ